MKKCRFNATFDYILYTEDNKGEVVQQLRAHGYSIASIDTAPSLLMYCKFNRETRMFESDLKVVDPDTYIVFYDTGDVSTFTEDQFNSTFEDYVEE